MLPAVLAARLGEAKADAAGGWHAECLVEC
jgi:hypothetical protein